MTDMETLEATTQAVGEAIAVRLTPVLVDAKSLSPWATLTALVRYTASVLLLHAGEHPEHRAALVALLRQAADVVELDGMTKH